MPATRTKTWRRLIPWVVSITLGLAATLGFAWGQRVWFALHGFQGSASEERKVTVQVPDGREFFVTGAILSVSEHWQLIPYVCNWRPDTLRRENYPTGAVPYWVDTPEAGRGLFVSAMGWPLRSMKEVSSLELVNNQPIYQNRGNFKVRTQTLPIIPIWPGFLANTLLFAALAWSLLFAPRVIRRWRRHRQNCCRACGYPRSAGTVCTECGAPLANASSPSVVQV